MLRTLRRDLRAVRERDPAARTTLEVVFCYPGLHAVWGYRIAHWMWCHKLRLLGRFCATVIRFLTNIEIHPAATLGAGLFIDHGAGVVIGATAEVGEDVTIYHGVTLGGTSLEQGKRHPTVGDRVTIGAGAKVLGPFTVGEGSRIGANAVVVKPVPSNSVVVGVPGQVVTRGRPCPATPDLDHTALPDLVGVSLQSLLTRVEQLEKQVNGQLSVAGPHAPEAGVWRGDDFSI